MAEDMRRRELKKTDGLWMALWLSLVTWAPLFIVRQSNPATSGMHLLAAPGIVLGAWLQQCASASLPEILRQRLIRSSFFVGALLTLYSVIPEWVLFLLGPLGERTTSFFGSSTYAAFRGVLAATQGGALLLLGICLGYCLASHCEPLPRAQVPTASSPVAYVSLGCCASLLQLWLCQRADGQPYSPGVMALCELAPIVLAACLSPPRCRRADHPRGKIRPLPCPRFVHSVPPCPRSPLQPHVGARLQGSARPFSCGNCLHSLSEIRVDEKRARGALPGQANQRCRSKAPHRRRDIGHLPSRPTRTRNLSCLRRGRDIVRNRSALGHQALHRPRDHAARL